MPIRLPQPTFLRPKVLNQPVQVFVVGCSGIHAGMGRGILLVRLNKFEGPLIHPFAPVGVGVGKAKRARFQVVGHQRIAEPPITGIHGLLDPAQGPAPFVFPIVAAIMLFFDKNTSGWLFRCFLRNGILNSLEYC